MKTLLYKHSHIKEEYPRSSFAIQEIGQVSNPFIYFSQPLGEGVMLCPHFADEEMKARARDWPSWNVAPV